MPSQVWSCRSRRAGPRIAGPQCRLGSPPLGSTAGCQSMSETRRGRGPCLLQSAVGLAALLLCRVATGGPAPMEHRWASPAPGHCIGPSSLASAPCHARSDLWPGHREPPCRAERAVRGLCACAVPRPFWHPSHGRSMLPWPRSALRPHPSPQTSRRSGNRHGPSRGPLGPPIG